MGQCGLLKDVAQLAPARHAEGDDRVARLGRPKVQRSLQLAGVEHHVQTPPRALEARRVGGVRLDSPAELEAFRLARNLQGVSERAFGLQLAKENAFRVPLGDDLAASRRDGAGRLTGQPIHESRREVEADFAAQRLHRQTKRPAQENAGETEQSLPAERHLAVPGQETQRAVEGQLRLLEGGGRHAVQETVLLHRKTAEAVDCRRKGRVEGAELGQDSVAHTGPSKLHVGVGGVVVKPKPLGVAVRPGLFAREDAHGAHDLSAALAQAGKAVEAATPGKVQEDGLDMIVGGMGRGNSVATRLRRRLFKEPIAGNSARLLQSHASIRSEPWNIGPATYERKVQLRAEGLAERHLAVGLGPLPMVEMRGDRVDSQAVEQVQHARGVRAAAVASQHAASARDQVGLLQMGAQALEHPTHVSSARAIESGNGSESDEPMKPDLSTSVDRLRSLARVQDRDVVREEMVGARAEDIAEGFQRLSIDEGLAILKMLDPEMAADVMVELPTETARQYLDQLPDSVLAHYLDILPPDDAADLHEELEPERFEALLEVIPREDAQEIRRLLRWPEGSVGRMMTDKFFEVSPDMTMADVLADIRNTKEDKYETVNDVYVLDENRHLVGLFSLRRAIRAAPKAAAREVMREDVVSVRAADTAEQAARTMARYGFYALPVLDDADRMVGILTGDDAQSILQEAETEDVLKLGGVSGDAEAYLSLNAWELAKRRLPWLVVLFVAEFLTGTVLRWYTDGATEEGVTGTQRLFLLAQLMPFIPLLIGAGGNSGSQVTTTITRALAIGEIKPGDYLVVMRREFGVALVVGSVLGLLGCARAYFGWGSGVQISLIVGLALPAIVIWATCFGSLLPLAAKRLGIDPAVMSAPFIATFVDATGLVIFFEIAQAILQVRFHG